MQRMAAMTAVILKTELPIPGTLPKIRATILPKTKQMIAIIRKSKRRGYSESCVPFSCLYAYSIIREEKES